MPWKLTIAGVDCTVQVAKSPAPVITRRRNERSTLSFSLEPGVLPDRWDEVVCYAQDGVTPLFCGPILKRTLAGLKPNTPDFTAAIECADVAAYADHCSISATYAVDTALEDILGDIATVLAPYGITYTPVATGVSIRPGPWTNIRCSDALRECMEKAQRSLAFSPTKAMSVAVPGGVAAPYTITDADPNCDQVGWEDPDAPPATRVILTCGPSSGAFLFAYSWAVNGTDMSWTLPLLGSTSPWAIEVGGVPKDVGTGKAYEWDAVGPGGRPVLSVGTDPTPTVGTVIEVAYWVAYPFELSAVTGATPVIEYRESKPTITSYESALQTITAILAAVSQEDRHVRIVTDRHGWSPDQKITIDVSTMRELDTTVVIEEVTITLTDAVNWDYELSATESEDYQPSYLDDWREETPAAAGGESDVGVSWDSIANHPTDLSAFTNGPGYITGAGSCAYAASAAAAPWSGLTGTKPDLGDFPNVAGYLKVVAWTDVSGRPTKLSDFTNDLTIAVDWDDIDNRPNGETGTFSGPFTSLTLKDGIVTGHLT